MKKESSRQSLKKTGLVFAFVGITNLLLVLRDLLLAHQFGSGPSYQAFLVAMIVPSFLLNVFTNSLSSSLVPKIVQKNQAAAPLEFERYVNASFVALLLTLLAVCLLLGLTSFAWYRLVLASLGEEQKAFAQSLLVPALFLTFLQASPVFFRLVLSASHRQIFATLSPALNIASLALLLLIFHPGSIEIYMLQVAIAYLAEILFLFFLCGGIFGFKGHLNLSKATFLDLFDRHFWYPISTSFLGASFLLVDQLMAARFPQGGIAALTYGQKITAAFIGVVSGAMGHLIFPELSSYVARKDWQMFKATIRKYTLWIFLSSSLVAAVLGLFSYDIIRILFERGAFHHEDTELVARINTFYLLQIPFYLIGQIAIKSLYSLQKGFYMTHVAIVTVFINALANYAFSIWFGIPGISLSTSLVFALSAGAVYYYLHRELQKLTA